MWPTLQATLSARRVEILLFTLVWLSCAYFYQGVQHNGAARIDQTRAIVEQGVLHIDDFRYNTADVVTIERASGATHVYPNKAPGTSLLAVAPFWLWKHALRPLPVDEQVYWHAVAFLTILSTISLLSALAAVAMYTVLRRITGDVAFSALAVIAVWLGTICFPFSTLFFSHQQAAAQLVLAFWFLFRLRTDGPARMRRPAAQLALAGFLCGFTLATEYPSILLVGLLCVYFVGILIGLRVPGRLRFQLAGAFVAGLIAGGLVLVGYNLAAFGKVFYVPYEAYAQNDAASAFPGHKKGYVGIHWPGWANFAAVLGEITVRPQRGVLYIGFGEWRVYACNPVLCLVVPGLVWLFLRKRFRGEAVLVGAMAVAYLTFNACFGDSIVYWGGAWSVGPRHLIPLLPFLALPLVEGARRLWVLFVPLLLVSVFYMLLATAVEPRVPYEYRNPARDLFLDKYLHGHLALNRERLFERDNRPLVGDSRAFNLGKLNGLPGTIQLLPLLLFWLIAGTGLLWVAGSARRRPTSNETDEERPPTERSPSDDIWAGLFRPRFSPAIATAVLAAFIALTAALPPLHAAHLRRELARGGGLLGKYYANTAWKGEPAFVRKDRFINFEWVLDPPLVGPFSVEWVGTIRIDRPGRYLFATESDDGSFLALDGKVVVDNGGSHSPRTVAAYVEVSTPGAYPLAIRYFNVQHGGKIRVTWQPPGRSKELLPPDVLNPPGAEGETR
jgi:hypothetical protein